MLLLLLVGAAVALATFFVIDIVTLPARERQGSLRRAAAYGRVQATQLQSLQSASFNERVLVPAKGALANLVLRITPKASMETVTLRLLNAGLGRRVTATGFLAAKGLLALAGFAVASLAGGLLVGLVFAVAGFMFPDIFLTFKTRARKEVLGAELPDALDLLAVSVEAGLGFDGAIARLTEHMDGHLAQEFALTLGEMRIGETRHNALTKMMKRVDTPEFSAFVRAIIQADQLGISLGRILKVQASDTRTRRQLAAEEKAMKAPIKMLFPTVLFIFPTMFIVILGPAFLNLSDLF